MLVEIQTVPAVLIIEILLAYNVPSTRSAYDRDTRSLQY